MLVILGMIFQFSWAEKPSVAMTPYQNTAKASNLPYSTSLSIQSYERVEQVGACYERALMQWEFRKRELLKDSPCEQIIPQLSSNPPCERNGINPKDKTVIVHQVQEFLVGECFPELGSPTGNAKKWVEKRDEQDFNTLILVYGLLGFVLLFSVLVWAFKKMRSRN